uniref:Methyl-accepting chemotaxis protein n=1 Tax=Candidatus Kentrum sp. FM TaxID=2126340 RepID=A0A450SX87_9GAMM|nr:MAG: hypothetical protein BECKFM1743C_GA0114222_102326 [Candidatus Kentron sp. FM]VFJ59557.1 MAG: hypothetical protein BECKFM1743A_GA0114220_102404 [Candidatus Kentron sp. FM]VFK14814.1 MAG: hypothetical protein BECKFM1743B_GA0114221_103412 [Candidatus Kentron sp. FM]
MATKDNTGKTLPGEDGAENRNSTQDSALDSLGRFAQTFESSAKRWEMIVYPSLFGFIVVAAYGFFLIYNVTRDMHDLAGNMDPAMHLHMKIMAQSISEMTKNVATMTANMNEITASMANMDTTVGAVNTSMAGIKSDMEQMSDKIRTLEPMLVNISEMNKSMHVMNQSVHSMSATTDVMSRDIGATSYQFVRPMSAINSFFPW